MNVLFLLVPLWLVAVVVLVLMYLHVRTERRINGHAESIANIDDWAEVVETEITLLQRSAPRKSGYMGARRYQGSDRNLWN